MPEQKINVNVGGSLLTFLGVLLVILKLAEVINWSWWIVLIPLYPLVVCLVILFGLFFFAGCVAVCEFFLSKVKG
jgi:hypothetical protein